ncbi:MAG: DsrE/DsrF/DrsH-like family protein [Candidatus Bathyarchaeia archaeon]|nr:DsrE/DsrF/DrsH-like family protein [Candidatus Bathyarchaeota archaeon]
MIREQPNTAEGDKTPRISIIVASDRVDKLFPAVTLASTAAVMNWEAELFFTTWGLLALRRGHESSEVSSDYKIHEEELRRALISGSMPGWREVLEEGKKTGRLRVYACSTTMGLFNLNPGDLVEIVDDVVGAAYFLGRAKESEVNLFIS